MKFNGSETNELWSLDPIARIWTLIKLDDGLSSRRRHSKDLKALNRIDGDAQVTPITDYDRCSARYRINKLLWPMTILYLVF